MVKERQAGSAVIRVTTGHQTGESQRNSNGSSIICRTGKISKERIVVPNPEEKKVPDNKQQNPQVSSKTRRPTIPTPTPPVKKKKPGAPPPYKRGKRTLLEWLEDNLKIITIGVGAFLLLLAMILWLMLRDGKAATNANTSCSEDVAFLIEKYNYLLIENSRKQGLSRDDLTERPDDGTEYRIFDKGFIQPYGIYKAAESNLPSIVFKGDTLKVDRMEIWNCSRRGTLLNFWVYKPEDIYPPYGSDDKTGTETNFTSRRKSSRQVRLEVLMSPEETLFVEYFTGDAYYGINPKKGKGTTENFWVRKYGVNYISPDHLEALEQDIREKKFSDELKKITDYSNASSNNSPWPKRES